MHQHSKYIRIWLVVLAFMTLSIVIIGGFTRLSNSGLSIVEWKPVTGIVPPMSDNDWQEEFAKYRKSPEFIKVNNQIDLADFQFIYLVEFIHRFFGRLTGLVYLLPLVYFYFCKIITPRELLSFSLIALLGSMQAAMGWFMVKSGLVDVPHVNHFKLTMHLSLALVIFAYIVDKYLFYGQERPEIYKNKLYTGYFMCLGVLLFLQIMLGGLTAGLKAGYIYNNFPLMGDGIIPPEVFKDGFFNLNMPISVQFLHRVVAIFILLYSLLPLTLKQFYYLPKQVRKLQYIFIAVLLCQLVLGVITLVTAVEVLPALAHQLMAFVVFAVFLWHRRMFCTVRRVGRDLKIS